MRVLPFAHSPTALLYERKIFMRLDIYDKKTIVKTYEADTYDLEFGILEDVADVVKIDDIETGSDAEILKMAAKAVIGSMDTVKYLLKDIFDGLTDDEIKHTRVSDIAQVLLDVIRYTIEQLNRGLTSKNQQRVSRS